LIFALAWALGACTYGYWRLGKLAKEVHPSKRKQWLSDKLPFEFKTGWAANLTTTGAILGTFLSAGVLPNDTVFISKEQYISLNVLFGLMLLIAGVVHNAFQSGRSFLWAYALTLGAGVGELITALLILEEIGFQHSMPTLIVRGVQIVLVAAAYFVTTVASSDAVKRIKTPRTKGGLV